jgi:HEAT repeats/HEAT repeat
LAILRIQIFAASFLSGVLLGFAHRCEAYDQPEKPLYEGKPVSAWIKESKDADPTIREKALQILDKKIIPDLIRNTKSNDYATRWGALEDLGRIGPVAKSATPVVGSLLKHEEAMIRVIAATTLKRIDPKTTLAVPILVDALGYKKDSTVRCFASTAFIHFGEEAVQPLFDALPGLDPFGRLWASGGLSLIGKPALPLLIKGLEHKSALIREASATAIANMADNEIEISLEDAKPALEALRRIATDPEPAVRDAVAKALRNWQRVERRGK